LAMTGGANAPIPAMASPTRAARINKVFPLMGGLSSRG
jgi:hypothetical protein